ncbi:M23 family metallopeptidase [Blautia sp. XA-2221]|uniref:M23 family metallopeptidase n=1 Tax=Blautia sp. XA-2221 TaxID=2903961 RepID=UPI002378C039|nr:M23 family metallopeptidase [Blautia sp. XA-2221]
MKRKKLFLIMIAFFYLLFLTDLEGVIRDRSRVSVLSGDVLKSEEFREQKLSGNLYKQLHKISDNTGDWIPLLAASMAEGGFYPEEISGNRELYRKYKPEKFQLLVNAYRAVWEDVRYFPVASSEIAFENTWLAKREYGGQRTHEGTDLFGKVTKSGYYPVVSMTSGIVEQKGWLPLGGYRIGIRSPHGGYFYYAHLSGYESGIEKGQMVAAGDVLGYMGNTGYGPEGTRGRFPVHLHLGIYIEVPFQKEMSVNPYWLLKIFEKKIRNYTY